MQDSKNRSWLKNSPLSLPNYRNLWIGQSISTFGDRFTSIALPILVYELTGQAWQLGFAFMLQVLASLVFGLWAGALSDRWDKRRTMIISDIAQAVLILIIPLILSTNLDLNAKLAVTYVVGFLISAATQFFRPAKIAIIPQLVDKERLVDANAWDQGATHFTQFLGYTISGFLIATTSTATAFYVDAATFVVSAFFISRIQINHSGKTEPSVSDTSIVDSIREGLAQATGVPLIRAVLILGLIVPMAFGGLQPLILVFSERVLGTGTIGFALISGSMALGSAAGFFVTGRLIKDQFRGYLLSFGVFFLGVFQLLGIVLPAFARSRMTSPNVSLFGYSIESGAILLSIALPFFLLTTIANSGIVLGIRTIIQESTPNEMIGRVFSVVGVGSSVAVALGSTSTGLADLLSVTQVMIFWCVVLIIVGIIAMLHPVLRPPSESEMNGDD